MDDISDSNKDCWPELKRLITIVKELSLAKDLQKVSDIVLHHSRDLTKSNGSCFVLKEKNSCYFKGENGDSPLWVGKRIPIELCISGWVMEHAEAVSIPDIYKDYRVVKETYRNTPIKSVIAVPILSSNPIGAIKTYWTEEHQPNAHEFYLLQALADATAIVMEKVQLYQGLERLVKERTAQLEHEIAERKKAEDIIRQQSLTDPLTGLLNRRGFYFQVEKELKIAHRFSNHSVLMFADLDGLKKINDTLGHAAGDQMIKDAANILNHVFRTSDVLARLGGDEFAAFTLESTDLPSIRNRINEAIRQFNLGMFSTNEISMSIGLVSLDPNQPNSLDELLEKADKLMYLEKQQKKI